jgi:hypothetical protein
MKSIALPYRAEVKNGALDTWYTRNNRRLRETSEALRLCWLEGCNRELTATQRKFCSDQHADSDRQRRQRAATGGFTPANFGYFNGLVATAALRRHEPSRPILRRGDTDRVYDRVRSGEGCLPLEARRARDLSPKWNGVALSLADREALEDGVCGICQRFAVDCAALTQHQAIAMRVVILPADAGSLGVAA